MRGTVRSLRPVLGDPSCHDECGGKSVGSGQAACVVSLLHPPPRVTSQFLELPLPFVALISNHTVESDNL